MESLREQLLRFKVELLVWWLDHINNCYCVAQHKMRSLVSTSKGTSLLGGELQSSSDLDFYINGVSGCNAALCTSTGVVCVSRVCVLGYDTHC